jgi:hypothetical protein
VAGILAALISVCPLVWAYAESVVTLKSGEIVQGEVLSDTNGTLQIRALSGNRTYSVLRSIADSDIQGIHTETPAEIAERTEYESLAKFQLNPNQEMAIDWYIQWMGAFEKFITNYPNSDRIPAVQHYLAVCKAESKNVSDGKVKFGNRWMTVQEKRVAVAAYTVQSLKDRLAGLQKRRTKLAQNIELSQSNLASTQDKLSGLQDTQVPVYGTSASPISPGARASGPTQRQSSYVSGYKTVENPERAAVQDQVKVYQQQVDEGQVALQKLDSDIADIQQSQIPKAEQDYQMAVAQSQEVPRPVVAKVEEHSTPPPRTAEEPPSPPPSSTVNQSVEAPQTWIDKNWMWLALGMLSLLILAGLLSIPLLNRRAARIQALQERQHQQRRFLYEQLKKIFDSTFVQGQRPAGKNKPEGEIVPVGRGQDDSGGGRWFVIGPSYIWAVQNNGRDDDNWALNNVVTDGHGAIGAFIPANEEQVETIKRLAAAVN